MFEVSFVVDLMVDSVRPSNKTKVRSDTDVALPNSLRMPLPAYRPCDPEPSISGSAERCSVSRSSICGIQGKAVRARLPTIADQRHVKTATAIDTHTIRDCFHLSTRIDEMNEDCRLNCALKLENLKREAPKTWCFLNQGIHNASLQIQMHFRFLFQLQPLKQFAFHGILF